MRDAIAAAAAALVAGNGEVSVVLTDDDAICTLNRDWRKIDKPTNVLSFPAADPDDLETAPLLGDIAIALETVMREAVSEKKAFRDHYLHLVVHGTLHLIGFDHEVDEEAEEMEDMERRILAGMGIADPYADPLREQRQS